MMMRRYLWILASFTLLGCSPGDNSPFPGSGPTGLVNVPGPTAGSLLRVPLPGTSQEMEFVYIPPGSFPMGASEGDGNEAPRHSMTIARGFYLGRFEVTQSQWTAVVDSIPWAGEYDMREGPEYPAIHINWKDAQMYISALNRAAGDSLFRLPTEAEWEYAARAGTTSSWSFGDDVSRLADYAWYDGNALDVGDVYAHRVGTKLPNRWGLYDMHGNVWEWVLDRYRNTYDAMASRNDPSRPAEGGDGIVRGGAFPHDATDARSAKRFPWPPGSSAFGIGFRLLLRAGPP